MLGLPFFKTTIWYSFCLQDKHTDENAYTTGYSQWNEAFPLCIYLEHFLFSQQMDQILVLKKKINFT